MPLEQELFLILDYRVVAHFRPFLSCCLQPNPVVQISLTLPLGRLSPQILCQSALRLGLTNELLCLGLENAVVHGDLGIATRSNS